MKLNIREFKEQDIPLKVKWVNDKRNNKYLHYDLPLKIDKTKKWFEKAQMDESRKDYTILYDDIPIGIIGLLNIDYINYKAELYILIGNNKYKGKNLGAIAISHLLFKARELSLRKIYLYTEEDNFVAQKLFEKVGFKREGLLENDIYHNNHFINRYLYAIDLHNFSKIK